MKERADVVVIGAGIVGCAAAHYLTLAGVRNVVVVDQGPIGDTGGSSFHAPGLCFQTNGSKLSCTLAQWSARALPRARHARAPHLVGGRLARGGHHAGAPGRGQAPPRLRHLVGPREPRHHARGGAAPHPAARPRAAARRAARAERRHRQGRQHLPGAAGARRGARRDVHRQHARDRHRHARRARARGRDRPGHRSRRRRRSSAWACGRPSSCARSACRWSRCSRCSTSSPGPTRCPSWPATAVEIEHPILRHQDRAMYFRQRGEGYGIGAYGHDPITIEPHELERHPDGPPDRDRPVLARSTGPSRSAGRTSCCRRSRRSASPRRSTATSRSRSTTTRSPGPRRRSPACGSPTASGSRTAAAPRRPSST